jgi:hypothetical protein
LKISQADNQYHKKQILHEKISSKFSKKSEPEGLVTGRKKELIEDLGDFSRCEIS